MWWALRSSKIAFMKVEERSALLKSIGESKTGLSALKYGMVMAAGAIGKIRRGQKVPDAELALYESGFATGGASVDDYVEMLGQFQAFVERAPLDAPAADADVLAAGKPDVTSAMVALLAQVEIMLEGSHRSLADTAKLMVALGGGQTFPREVYLQKGQDLIELAGLAGQAMAQVVAVKQVLADG